MIKTLLPLLFSLILPTLCFAGKVRIYSVGAPTATLIHTSTFTLTVEPPSSDGTTEDGPAKVYIPLKSTSGGVDSSTFSTFENSSDLPRADIEGTLRIYVDVSEVVGTEYLIVAMQPKDQSDYKVIYNSGAISNGTGVTIDLNLKTDLCDKELNCTNLTSSSNPSTVLDENLFYVFTSTTSIAIDNTIVPTDQAGGIYYEFIFSNKVYSGNVITLSELRKGDSQLTAVYQGFDFENLSQVVALNSTSGTCEGKYTLATVTNNYPLTETVFSGEAKVKPLVNDTPYRIGIYYKDKFGFASLISNCLEQTPQRIEALLEKNGCFLLTAGFRGDHPLIDFFRGWRDKFLLKTFLGSKFVNFYYEWGPQLAPIVLETPWLASSIRGMAHISYWIIKYNLWVILLIGTVLFSLFKSVKYFKKGIRDGRA